MPIAKLNEISLYYEVHGQGPPLVCISGYSSDYSVWLGIVEFFKEKFQLILLSNRGMGQSTAPDRSYTVEELGEDALALLDYLRIDAAHFWGTSMGGAAIQTLCYRHPKRVLSAVLGNTFACFEHIDSRWRLHNSAALQMPSESFYSVPFIENRIAWVFSERFLSKPERLEKAVAAMLKNPHPPSIKSLKAQWSALENFDAREHLKQIRVPCLVMGSDDDLLIPQKSFEYLVKNISGARSHLFQDVGHVSLLEMTQEYLGIVKNFWDLVLF